MSFIFGAVEPKDLEMVVDAMEEKSFHGGEVVIRQGDEGNNLYVVESGTLDCSKRIVRSVPTLVSLGKGREAALPQGVPPRRGLWRAGPPLQRPSCGHHSR